MRVHALRFIALAGAATALAACGIDRPTPIGPPTVSEARFAADARFASDTDPRARWEFHANLSDANATLARIAGDGRSYDGSPTAGPSSYQGRWCGVHAKIFIVGGTSSGSGDGVLDPDAERSSCSGGARYLNVDRGNGPERTAPFTNTKAIDQMAPGTSKVQAMKWSVALSGCERLVFDNVSVVRTDDGLTAPRTWVVETTAPHTAICENTVKGKTVLTGPTNPLPYRVTITEIL